jgi:hypothetical protein
MSANLFGERFLGRREPAWHGLGTVFAEDEHMSCMDAFERANLLYRFYKVERTLDLPDGTRIPSANVSLVREPTRDDPIWREFGDVKPNFGLIQNVDLARYLDRISQKWPLETVGALDYGKTTFVTFSTGSYDIMGDEIRKFLVVSDGRSGDQVLRFMLTDIRVVCHAKGTPIIDGQWRGNVEDHSSARGTISGPGRQVSVRGLPFPERVSNNHRYWARQRRRSLTPERRAEMAAVQGSGSVAVAVRSTVGTEIAPDWVHAEDLLPVAHEIGMPIDMTEEQAPAIPVAHVLSSGWTGEWMGNRHHPFADTFTKTVWAVERDPRLDDPEWWWLIGYWWGNGHLNRSRGKLAKITLTVAMTQPEIRERIVRLLRSTGWSGAGTERQGCWQITFGDQTLASFLATWYQGKAASKTPPVWVECLPLALQRALVQGYYAADGGVDTTHGCILASVHLDGLLCLRRILLRLGIPSSIRSGGAPGSTVLGRQVNMQQGYTIRFWRGVEQLGYTTRFKGEFSHPYIEDGWLWSRVESVEEVADAWVPITTTTHDYLTAFGRSHNCQNTLEAAWESKKTGRISFMHRKDVHDDLALYVDLFEQIQVAQERQQRAFQILAETKANREQVKEVIAAAFPMPDRKNMHQFVSQLLAKQGYLPARAQELLETAGKDFDQKTLVAAAKNLAGLELFDRLCESAPAIAGTAWAAYNAVAEFSDNRAGENVQSVAKSTLFGERSFERAHAFTAAWKLTGINESALSFQAEPVGAHPHSLTRRL